MKYGALNHEQARFYRDQGYFKLLDVYDAQQTAEMRHFIVDELNLNQTTDTEVPANPNKKMYGLYNRNMDIMSRVIGNRVLVGALESLLGPNVVFIKNRHNHATVNNQQGAPAEGMHRDVLQPCRGLITAAVYLQDSTMENGATRVVPGSHNLPYVGAPQKNGGGTWMSEHEEYSGLESQAISVPMQEGDVLLFNGTLFHGVGYNPSGQTRMSMTLGFRSADELDASPDETRQVVVSGKHIYRGNDRF